MLCLIDHSIPKYHRLTLYSHFQIQLSSHHSLVHDHHEVCHLKVYRQSQSRILRRILYKLRFHALYCLNLDSVLLNLRYAQR